MRERGSLLVGESAEDSGDDQDKEMGQSKKGEQHEREARRIHRRIKEDKVQEIRCNRKPNGKEIERRSRKKKQEEVSCTERGLSSPVKAEEQKEKKVMTTTALTRNKAQVFPTTRRPVKREIPNEALVGDKEIEDWFDSTSLRLGEQLTQRERSKAMRLVYTWRDTFETELLRIRPTDLIEHAIIFMPGAMPHRARKPLYMEEEIAFCRSLIRKMEEAGLIFRCDSEWGARTKFLLKPRADTPPKDARLRMVHDFIPLNRVTEKSRYLCLRIEQIIYTGLKKRKRFFFTSDATNSYWAIPVRPGDEPKLGFVTPYGMYCYKLMGQGLTGRAHPYGRFRDLVFSAIPEGFDEINGV